ncbi:MAG: flagellar export protein FliJ [Planctomycetota bacterium]
MRRFRFRLASVLRLREQFERSARRDLAVAIADVHTFDQRLAAAAQGLRDCADQAASSSAVGQLARSLETGLRRHEWRLRTNQKVAQKKLDVVRADYVVKVRELRTLSKLREQRHAQWRSEAQKSEQAELDELALLGRKAARARAQAGGNEA